MIRSSRILSNRKAWLDCLRPAQALVDAEWVNTGATPMRVFASSRPLNHKEAQLLIEGQRSDEFRVINCDQILYAADDKLGVIGDIVTNHLGFHWRVVASIQWGDGTRHNSYRLHKYALASDDPI